MSTLTVRPINARDLIGRKVLVTCDNWFYAPDGRQYRAVHGTLVAIQTSEESLGVKVSARSQDWYMTVGNMKIAGCQIHFAVLAETAEPGRVMDYTTAGDKGYSEFERPCHIFFADEAPPSEGAES